MDCDFLSVFKGLFLAMNSGSVPQTGSKVSDCRLIGLIRAKKTLDLGGTKNCVMVHQVRADGLAAGATRSS